MDYTELSNAAVRLADLIAHRAANGLSVDNQKAQLDGVLSMLAFEAPASLVVETRAKVAEVPQLFSCPPVAGDPRWFHYEDCPGCRAVGQALHTANVAVSARWGAR